jgi:FixJ family two-component response regulator
VLDIRMPGMSGLVLQQNLIERRQILPIIFITGHGDAPLAIEALKGGAVGFLQKPWAEQDLLDLIDRALEMDAANWEALKRISAIRQRMNSLTPRQRQVMFEMANGHLNKIIASNLRIAESTVEQHRKQVMVKMKVPTLAHLVRMLVSAGEI